MPNDLTFYIVTRNLSHKFCSVSSKQSQKSLELVELLNFPVLVFIPFHSKYFRSEDQLTNLKEYRKILKRKKSWNFENFSIETRSAKRRNEPTNTKYSSDSENFQNCIRFIARIIIRTRNNLLIYQKHTVDGTSFSQNRW